MILRGKDCFIAPLLAMTFRFVIASVAKQSLQRLNFMNPSKLMRWNTGEWLLPMSPLLVTLVPLTILLGSSNATAAEPSTSRGAALMNACAACHGPDGQSKGAIPSIAIMSKENLVETLRAFQAGTRQGTVMNRIAK